MPSPFPGMDPYLESPAQWEGFHQYFIVAMAVALNAMLPAEFAARIGERIYVMEPDYVVPDITVLPRPPRQPSPPIAGAGTAVLEPPALPFTSSLLVFSQPEQMREIFIDIIAVRDGRRVITTIELLSPANKRRGSGAEEYQRKQEQILSSNTHFLEIDLLRAGRHSVAVSESSLLLQRNAYDYLASLHRAGAGQRFEVWPFLLHDVLPCVRVPLTEAHEDVPLYLQAILNRVYDEGVYDRSIDYTVSPDPPLAINDTAWLDTLLREKGLR